MNRSHGRLGVCRASQVQEVSSSGPGVPHPLRVALHSLSSSIHGCPVLSVSGQMPHLVLRLSLHILSPNLVTSSFKMCHQVSNFSTLSSAPPGAGRSHPLDDCKSPPVAPPRPFTAPIVSAQLEWWRCHHPSRGASLLRASQTPAVAGEASSFSGLPQALAFSCLSSLSPGGAGGPHTAACTCLSSALHGPRTQQDQGSPPSASSSGLVVPGRPLPATCPMHTPWPSCALLFLLALGAFNKHALNFSFSSLELSAPTENVTSEKGPCPRDWMGPEWHSILT